MDIYIFLINDDSLPQIMKIEEMRLNIFFF